MKETLIETVPVEHVVCAITWLGYEHDLDEIYGECTVEDLRESHRVCDKKIANLLEALGCDSWCDLNEKFDKNGKPKNKKKK